MCGSPAALRLIRGQGTNPCAAKDKIAKVIEVFSAIRDQATMTFITLPRSGKSSIKTVMLH
jgi:hypothetical protein